MKKSIYALMIFVMIAGCSARYSRAPSQMAIPLILITLRVAVVRPHPGQFAQANALAFIKMIICSAAGWAVGRHFDLEPIAFAILILQWTTPVAVTSFLLAKKYSANAQPVAELVVVSSLMSALRSASFANNFASKRRNVCSLITTFSIQYLAQQYMSEI